MGRFQGGDLRCCGTIHRLHWVGTGVGIEYTAGRALIAGFNSLNINRHGYTSGFVGANDDAGHSTVQNERLKRVQGKHNR